MNLLELKQKMKKKRPKFIRQEANRFRGRIRIKWRKPKGIHSKMRTREKGKPLVVKPGYGSPDKARCLLKSGLMPVIVRNASELAVIDSGKQAAMIAGSVGKKKRLMIIEEAKKKCIKIANVKEGYAEKIRKELEERKKKAVEPKKAETKKMKKEPKEATEEKLADKEAKRLEAEKVMIKK